MIKEAEYEGDYIYKYHKRANPALFFKKLTTPRPYGPDLLMRAVLPADTL
jgi:hypothetical protein